MTDSTRPPTNPPRAALDPDEIEDELEQEGAISGEEPPAAELPELLPVPEPPAVPRAPEPPAVVTPAAEKRTPEGWAERLGHVHKAKPHIPQSVTHTDWKHAGADKAYGWSKHAFHYQNEPLLLTQEDYEQGLEAAAEYPAKPLHEPAFSPYFKPENV